MKRTIIFSYGPVPIDGQNKVEGGGLRCWGLANGLRDNDADMEITVAYHESYGEPKTKTTPRGIEVKTWSLGNIPDLLSGYDTIIVSYCMGDLSVEVTKAVQVNQQLILDCYVPIYIEISARNSDNLEQEYTSFKDEVYRWAFVLKRGDLFLCANKNQKRFYQGVLSALGRINPATYSDELILEVPYGIYRDKPAQKAKPITNLVEGKDSKRASYKKVLWFGGIYPWFDLKTLVDAIEQVNKDIQTKLVLVGTKNPFNAHPDFVKAHDDLMQYIDSKKTLSNLVVKQDWVSFEDRADWYLDSDVVIMINKEGEENELAWRTRLVDYIWADLPILTNAGDPLGEELVDHHAAKRLEGLDADSIAEGIKSIISTEKIAKELKANINKVRRQLYWDVSTKELAKKINASFRPTDVNEFGYSEVIGTYKSKTPLSNLSSKLRMLPVYYKKHGGRSTYHVIRSIAKRQSKKFGIGRDAKKIVFVSHQLDMTGGPLVLLDLVEDFRRKNPRLPVEFHTYNPADKLNIKRLNKVGIQPILHLGKDYGFDFSKGDVVVLNTVAYSKQFFDKLFHQVRIGVVKKLIWYVHEDEPEIIFSKSDKQKIEALLSNNKIIIYTPAIKSTQNYQQYFKNKTNIRLQYYRLNLPKSHNRVLDAGDFSSIRFILPGMVGDGRKGQLPIFYAFSNFVKDYYSVNPREYRDFTLDFVGMGDDFYSRQIIKHSDHALKGHLTYHDRVDHEESLRLIKKANVTICYSLRECLPIFVFEGMAVGHPILRNDCSGEEEQLVVNENGYKLNSHDFHKVTASIEKLLSKTKTSNDELAAMSRVSQNIAHEFTHKDFNEISETISDSYTSK